MPGAPRGPPREPCEADLVGGHLQRLSWDGIELEELEWGGGDWCGSVAEDGGGE